MERGLGGLSGRRCFNHQQREAAALCPECGRFFCRECVTEHEDRVLCASCLRGLHRQPLHRRFGFAALAGAFQGLLGILLLWVFFYYLGLALISIPSSFHEGTVWQGLWNGGR